MAQRSPNFTYTAYQLIQPSQMWPNFCAPNKSNWIMVTLFFFLHAFICCLFFLSSTFENEKKNGIFKWPVKSMRLMVNIVNRHVLLVRCLSFHFIIICTLWHWTRLTNADYTTCLCFFSFSLPSFRIFSTIAQPKLLLDKWISRRSLLLMTLSEIFKRVGKNKNEILFE